MDQTAAINIALGLTKNPAFAKHLSHAPLPDAVTDLLAIAAGNAEALGVAKAQTEQTAEALRAAAAFFIEQVMFTENADSYRILGSTSTAPRSELRRHMVLLMSWLHPDTHEQRAGWDGVDRSVFIHRVIRAWADLKNDDRRGEYDKKLGEFARRQTPVAVRAERIQPIFAPFARSVGGRNTSMRETQRFRRLVMFRLQNTRFAGRLLNFLRDRQ